MTSVNTKGLVKEDSVWFTRYPSAKHMYLYGFDIFPLGTFIIYGQGDLPDGQEIAVKRLSETSRQGIEELKTELLLVAKLNHKNLVRLVGVCLEEREKILVYEYMPNRSLDNFIFGE